MRLGVLLTGLVALLAAVAVGGVYWHRSATYAAPRFAGYFGTQPGRPLHIALGDGDLADYRMVGAQGVTQYFEWGLINDGNHDVTISGADFVSSQVSFRTRVLDQLSWSPYREDPNPTGLITGLPAASRPFPAKLPAHGQLNILLRVTKPLCDSDPSGRGLLVSANLRLHWKAMISSHTTEVGPDSTIALCG